LKFDGHKIKNGIKVVASSVKRTYKHNFNGDKIFFPQNYEVKLSGLPLDDFRYMCSYYLQHNYWLADMIARYNQEFIYM
jgi:hypothetical protein